jgi:hypothetical protein
VPAAVADVPFEWAFAWSARIDAVIWNGQRRGRGGDTQVHVVAEVFDGHPKREQLVRLVATERREMFNTPYIHAVQRLLVQEAVDGAVERAGDRARMQALFLGISNVVSPASSRPTSFDLAHNFALMMRANIKRIWPFVVTEGAIAHTPVLRDHLAHALAGSLHQPGVERLSLMSMADFETACWFIEHDYRLAMILKRWQHGERRDTDFGHFCSSKQDLRRPKRASLVHKRWDRLTS